MLVEVNCSIAETKHLLALLTDKYSDMATAISEDQTRKFELDTN